jgi:hypothetical protein
MDIVEFVFDVDETAILIFYTVGESLCFVLSNIHANLRISPSQIRPADSPKRY